MADIHSCGRTFPVSEAENPLLSCSIKPPTFKGQIVTRWRRFSSGLWRVPEDDISAAYRADIFPKLKTFVEGGQFYTTMGIAYGRRPTEAMCHPLLPVGSAEVPTKAYSSEGKVGIFKGTSWILGPQVTFVAEDPPVAEWQHVFRAMIVRHKCTKSE